MVASIHVLHASPPEIGGFLRIGRTGHRKLKALLAANRLQFRRFVFDAAHIAEQVELVKSLRERGYFITQRSRQLADLSNVPELRRAEHLLLRHLDTAVRAARLGSRLHPDDQALVKAISASKKRLVNLRDTLGDLHATDSSATSSSAPMFRGNFNNLNSAAGGQRK